MVTGAGAMILEVRPESSRSGVGGYHLRIHFSDPRPTAVVVPHGSAGADPSGFCCAERSTPLNGVDTRIAGAIRCGLDARDRAGPHDLDRPGWGRVRSFRLRWTLRRRHLLGHPS